MRHLIRAAAVGASLVTSVLVAPQAIAEDARTHTVAEVNTAAAGAAATLCGSGYELEFAERLPDSRRYGTLFTYTKSSPGKYGVCAVFDNNTSGAKHMKLKLCPNLSSAPCKVDEGTYSQYAGPVKYESSNANYVMCSQVTALMWDSSGKAIIDRVRSATLCD